MFIVVGERINTSREKVQEAARSRDFSYIQDDVMKQEAAGATHIDVNASARLGCEREDMKWLLNVIQEVVSIPLCLDDPDPGVLEMAYSLVTQPPMINSISLEKKRYDAMLPFLKAEDCSVVALCMDDTGMPRNFKDVVQRAGRLVEKLEGVGIKRDKIYVDPTVPTISTDVTNGVTAMESVGGLCRNTPVYILSAVCAIFPTGYLTESSLTGPS